MTLSSRDSRAPMAGALAGYVLLSVVLTWPLAANLSTHLPLGDNDLLQNYWNFWWWKHALFELNTSPYHTDLLFHPGGTGLGLHTHSEANIILTLPVNLLFGPAAALNLTLLAGFVLGGFGAFLLAREYVAGTWPPFLAGLIYTFFPNHVEHALDHVNLASIQGLPLLLWAVVRLSRNDPRGWLYAGLLGAYTTLLGRHNAILAAPLAAALLIREVRARREPWRRVLRDLVRAGILGAVVLAPFIWPTVRDAVEQVGYFRKGIAPRGIDPLFLLVPHASHPLWGGWFADLYREYRTYDSMGFTTYLGWTSVILAAAAWWPSPPGPDHRRGGRLFWSVVAVIYLNLSLAERLTVMGQTYPSVPTLFGWLQKIPFVAMVRVPHRFMVPAVLALAMLAAWGSAALLHRVPARRWSMAAGLMVLLLAVDLMWLPFPLQAISAPGWIGALDDLPEGAAILNLPGGHRARASKDMFLQTFHHRPIAGGYVSVPIRRISRKLERYPVLRTVFQSRRDRTDYEGPGLIAAIRTLDVGAVVVHRDRTPERLREQRRRLARNEPADHYRLLPYKPDQGMPSALLERFRADLRGAFGPPAYTFDGGVEIYLTGDGSPSPGS